MLTRTLLVLLLGNLFLAGCESVTDRQVVGTLTVNPKFFYAKNEQLRGKPTYLEVFDSKSNSSAWIYPGPKVLGISVSGTGGSIRISGLNNAPEATITLKDADLKDGSNFYVRGSDANQIFDIRGRRTKIIIRNLKVHHDFSRCSRKTKRERYWQVQEYFYTYRIEFLLPSLSKTEPYGSFTDAKGEERVSSELIEGDCV
jgi:hypothetical protein